MAGQIERRMGQAHPRTPFSFVIVHISFLSFYLRRCEGAGEGEAPLGRIKALGPSGGGADRAIKDHR